MYSSWIMDVIAIFFLCSFAWMVFGSTICDFFENLYKRKVPWHKSNRRWAKYLEKKNG